MCTFMNKGSCKIPFNEWVECIDKNAEQKNNCEDLKVALASCMIQDEYYDIFVAKFM